MVEPTRIPVDATARRHRTGRRVSGRAAPALVVVLLLLVAMGAWLEGVARFFPSEGVDLPIVVVADSGQAALFVRETVSHRDLGSGDSFNRVTTRLAVYDLQTGERTSRRVLSRFARKRASFSLPGRAPGGVWFVMGTRAGVQLLDAGDGRVARKQDQLMSEDIVARLLRSGPLEDRVVWMPDDRALLVRLTDGTWSRLNGSSGGSAQFTGPAPRPGRPDTGAGNASPLGDGAGPWCGSTKTTSAAASFLTASLVRSAEGGAIVLQDPESILVAHSDTLASDAARSLSRVRVADGVPLWTASIGAAARLDLAHANSDALVLVIRVDGDMELASLSLTDGREHYRRELD